MQWYQRLPASGSELMAWVAPSLVVAIVYFGVSEGLWSASPGKLLVGLRVIEAGSQPPRHRTIVRSCRAVDAGVVARDGRRAPERA